MWLARFSPELASVHSMKKDEYKRYLGSHSEPLTLFPGSRLLEALTVTPFYVPPVYWAAVIALGHCFLSPVRCSLAFAGFLLWYPLEYCMHRFLFHAEDSLPNLVHFLAHGIHHRCPKDSGRLMFPPLASTALGAPIFAALLSLFGLSAGWSLMAGLIVGYQNYELMHYAIHHHPTAPGVRLLVAHHSTHHYTKTPCNYGVSSPALDLLFGTNKRATR